MRIIIDIGHPAHVHLFKHFAWQLIKKGHEILFTARDKEHEIYLLKHYGFDLISFGKHFGTIQGKFWGLLKFNFKLLNIALKFKPDILFSHSSIYASHTAFLFNKPHISMEDSGNMEQIKLYRPFSKVILIPDVLPVNLGSKQIKYNGYHELTYLRPKYFKPDRSVYKYLNIKENEPYCIIRFVAWKATHDKGQSGINGEYKSLLINKLSGKLKIFISSESKLPEEFEKFKINIPPEKMHDALAFATLYIGEGATMASEAGILGTPSIYVNSIKVSNCEDQSKYGLVHNFRNPKEVLETVEELLKIPNIKEEWQKRRQKMLADKIDVTAFMVWFIENYPESVRIMKENPDYQNRFK